MIRCDSFARATAFAALAAGGCIVWAVTAGPWLGTGTAVTAYLVGACALYVFALVPTGSRRVVAMLCAAGAAIIVAVHAQVLGQLALGLAAIVGVARGVTCHRTSPSRAIAIELVLGGAALLFAAALVGSTVWSVAVALWAYLLVQSCFFLIGGVRTEIPAAQPDPFEDAYRRAIALLDLECGMGWAVERGTEDGSVTGHDRIHASDPA